MKKITLFILLCHFFYFSFSQCPPNSSEKASIGSSNTGFVQSLYPPTYVFTDEYVTVTNILSTDNYQFMSTHEEGGVVVNDYITITDISNNPIASGMSPLSKANIAQTSIRIHIRLDGLCTTDLYAHKVSFIDLTEVPNTCQQPTVDPKTTLTYRSDQRMDITWYAPEYSSPEGYEWMFVPQGGGTSFSGSTVAPNTSISTGDVLMPNTTYDISIRSTCGVNGFSDYTTFSIKTNVYPPPVNDLCSGAITLIEETGVADAGSATATPGTLLGGAGTDVVAEVCGSDPDPGNARDDVWYKFVAQTINVNITVEPSPSFDAVVTLYSGNCNSLSYLACSDTNNSGNEEINYSGLTVGQTYYTRTYFYGPVTPSTPTFDIKIWSTTLATDDDNDGYVASVDCDDNDPNEFPGQTWYLDADSDGYGNGTSAVACERPADYYLVGELTQTIGDCNDSVGTIYPGAAEVWYDGVDQNCDGQSDYDQDGDGYDSESFGGNDCDDTIFAVNPGQVEIEGNGLDDDCNPATPDDPLGVEEFNLENVKISPNPFNQSINIRIPSGNSNEYFSICLYDLNGREIFQKYMRSSNKLITIDHLSVLQQGLYFIKITSKEGNKNVVRELIKY